MTKTNAKSVASPPNPNQTWAVIVKDAIERLGGSAYLSELYSELQNHPKAKANPTFQATIRRTLQLDQAVEAVSKGFWKLKSKK